MRAEQKAESRESSSRKSDASDEAEQRLVAELDREAFRDSSEVSSNYEAMCEAEFRKRQFSRPCPRCGGVGEHGLGTARIEYYARKLAAAQNERERANIRIRRADESRCNDCDGTGFAAPPQRDASTQRTWCEDCFGTGTKAGGDSCRRCRGLGHLCLGEMDSMFTLARCPRCLGCGEVPDEEAEDVCPVCRGDMWTTPVTVRSKGSSRHGFGPDVGASQYDSRGVSGSVLEEHHIPSPDEREIPGRDEAIIDALERLSGNAPELAAALRAYRGTVGDRWARGLGWGRTFAVWPHTRAGQTLMAEASEAMRREMGARPLELLARIRDEEDRARVPTMRTRALITLADRQARILVDAARKALAEVLHG